MIAKTSSATGNTSNRINETTIPLPNIIKSLTLNNPKINIDFFALAGIKY